MNILFLYGSEINPERGGVQRVTSVLADEFAQRGNRVFYLSLSQKQTTNANFERQFFLPDTKFGTPENCEFIKNFLREKHIDIVINQGGLAPSCSRLAYGVREIGLPLVSVVHNGLLDVARNYGVIHEYSWRKQKIGFLSYIMSTKFAKNILLALYKRKYRKHFQDLCKNSNCVVLLSEAYKKDLACYMEEGICPENVVAIPNPCSFESLSTHGLISEKRKEILYVGRIDFSQKRTDLLIEIWANLESVFPEWSLTIVGGGKDLDELKKIAQKKRLICVSFTGFQPPEKFFSRAAICCTTSAFEGFPMVLGEALTYGCVPIAFNSYAAAADIINDGVNGILVPPMDCEKYVNVLAAIMRDSARRNRMAEAALEKAYNFSIKSIANKWQKIFDIL